MDKIFFVLIINISLFLSVGTAQAAEFKGVNVPDDVLLEGANEKIKLNGIGVRTKFFFDIYVGALYLTNTASTTENIVFQKGPKRVFMHFLYDEVAVEKLVAGWNEGFEGNLTDKQLAGLATRINEFNKMFDTVYAGDEVLLDYLPGQGTRVTIKGKVKGIVEGEDFNQALLKIWLGDEPADEDLKNAMLNNSEG